MARGKAHTEDKKAKVVAALMAGGAVAQVAREFDLPESTVRTWGEAGGVDFAVIRAEKKERLDDLIANYLRENLLTLAAHAQMARNPKWFQYQKAEGLAIFMGVMADKTIRILEAAAAAREFGATVSIDDTQPVDTAKAIEAQTVELE